MHEISIRNGRIFDGTGVPEFTADIGIDGDRITAVGDDVGPGKREIDAVGKLVTPGWIDIHTHMDAQVSWDPNLDPSCYNGVTTVVMGNCGVGFAPVRPAERDWLLDLLDAVEDIPSTAMSAGITWEWETFPEYLDAIDGKPRVMDIATQIPHSPLRCYVMGARGADDIQPNDEELTHMTRLVREAIEAGRPGLLLQPRHGASHQGRRAHARLLRPLPPSWKRSRAAWARAAAASSRSSASSSASGSTTSRWSRTSPSPTSPAKACPTAAAPAGARACAGSRRRTSAASASSRRFAAAAPAPCSASRARRTPTGSTWPTASWSRDLPFKERIAKMQDPEVKAAILASEWDLSNDVRQFMDADPAGHIFLIDGTPGSLHAIFLDNLLSNPHKAWVLGDPPNYEPEYEASVAAYAERHGIGGDEAFYDLLTQGDGRTILLHYLEGYSEGNLDYQREQMMHPLTRNGLSDAGAHVGSLSDVEMASWNLRYWGWQRERGARVPIETIVHKQSGANADLYGLGDRGVLAVGKRADLNVIDPERLGSRAPHIIYDLPEGAKRFHQRQTGYDFTLCAGQITLESDELTGALPGRLVRGPRDA